MLPRMPTILLVRHGQASFGASDYDELSAAGREQATVAARHLASLGLDIPRIVTGALRRQRDTAAAAGELLSIEPIVDPRWDEYAMDEILATYSRTNARASVNGPGQATSSADFQHLLDQALAAWIAAGEDGDTRCEAWPAFARRIQNGLSELAAQLPPGATGLVFTSGGVIGALCAALLDLTPATMLSFNRVAVNTGITKLVSGRRGITLVSFNEHGHLPQSGQPITYR